MNQAERPGDGFESLIDRGVWDRLSLQVRERFAHVSESGRSDLGRLRAAARFDAVHAAHRLSDGFGHGHEARRNAGAL
jgi:hypothetical protein